MGYEELQNTFLCWEELWRGMWRIHTILQRC